MTGEDQLIASVLSEILTGGALTPLPGYLPQQGLLSHRGIIAKWLTAFRINAELDGLAHHAISFV